MITKKSVAIFESTYDAINKNKGDTNIAAFIDIVVDYYLKHINDDSEYKKINEKLESIHQTVKTNLGLNCEVLHQAGILNGNGEVTFEKKSK